MLLKDRRPRLKSRPSAQRPALRRYLPLACGAAIALAALAAAPVLPASTAQGVYTDAQATAGAEIYAGTCAMCHGQRLEGTSDIPALTGKFMANWANAPLSSLFDYVATAMPQHAPGSLSPEDNAKIVAFLLRANGMPSGSKPLPASPDSLKTISFAPARTEK